MFKNSLFIFNLNNGEIETGLYNKTQEEIDAFGTGIYAMFGNNPETPENLNWCTLICFKSIYQNMQIKIKNGEIRVRCSNNDGVLTDWAHMSLS